MIRTQIQLEESQAAALRRLAAEQGVSMAELIRRAIDESLLQRGEGDARYRRALSALGKGRSGLSDVSRKHDEYFVETLLDE
ncbi:MAG: ribbon-helix-helix protein, CopG family [Actinomycetota bacterium]